MNKNLVKFLMINLVGYGKGVQPFFCLPFNRLPPSDLHINKHRTAHALRREPSVCLLSCVEYWRYSIKENKSQKLNVYIVSSKENSDAFPMLVNEPRPRKRGLACWLKTIGGTPHRICTVGFHKCAFCLCLRIRHLLFIVKSK